MTSTFGRNGYSPKIIVFDDSSPAAQEKYYPLLEQTRTHNDVYYVGPKEKEQFTAYLRHRLRGQASRRTGEEPVPPQLRRQPQLHTHAHARRIDDLRRRRHATLRLMEDSLEIARRKRNQSRATPPRRTEWLRSQILRHRRIIPRCSWQVGGRGARQLHIRRITRRYRNGPGDQRLQGR